MSFMQKLPYYMRIVWGLLVLFCFVGVVSGRTEASAATAVVVAVMWTLLRIVGEAIGAAMVLKVAKKLYDDETLRPK